MSVYHWLQACEHSHGEHNELVHGGEKEWKVMEVGRGRFCEMEAVPSRSFFIGLSAPKHAAAYIIKTSLKAPLGYKSHHPIDI